MNIYTVINENEKADAIIVSDDIYEDAVLKLNKLDIEVIPSFKNKNVNKALSKHADMQIVKVQERTYVCAPETYDYYSDLLKKFKIHLIPGKTHLSSNYPQDIAYNIVITDKFAFHNFKYTDSILMDNINYKLHINVKQGYSACTVCKVDDNSFITADEGCAKTLRSEGFDVLKITSGHILLPGFDYGFFGGASFKISSNILAVNGDIATHPDCKNICAFCNEHNVDILSLSDKPLMDIGSGVALEK